MPTNTWMDYCSNCGGSLPTESQFCPRCGAPLVANETVEQPAETVGPDETLEPEVETVGPDVAVAPVPELAEPPATVHQMQRRSPDIHPVEMLGGLGGLTLMLAIIFLAAAAEMIDGFVLLGLAIALLALFVAGIRREPHTGTARVIRRGANRLRSLDPWPR